ncbi:hypothetical protein JOD82_001916 [Paenibacillus sp. 1182]|nr:hypothetical protein [Paenibacillus sp. 1182]
MNHERLSKLEGTRNVVIGAICFCPFIHDIGSLGFTESEDHLFEIGSCIQEAFQHTGKTTILEKLTLR